MWKKSTILIALATLGTLDAASARAASVSPESFVCSRTIELETIDKGSLVAVPLGDEMYFTLQPSHTDLRVFDDQNHPIASVVRKIPAQTKEYLLFTEAVTKKINEDRSETIITMRTARRPIHRIEFETPDRNFRRQVVLFASPSYTDNRDWHKVDTCQITRIDLDGVQQESLTMTFPEQKAARLKIRIIHGANRPIEIQRARLFGPTYECRFIAEPERRYTLEYGSTLKKLPPLDTAALDAAEQNGLTPIAGRLSNKVLNRKKISEDGSSIDRILTTPWIIYPVIGLLILLMTLGLFVAARRMPLAKDGEEKADP